MRKTKLVSLSIQTSYGVLGFTSDVYTVLNFDVNDKSNKTSSNKGSLNRFTTLRMSNAKSAKRK